MKPNGVHTANQQQQQMILQFEICMDFIREITEWENTYPTVKLLRGMKHMNIKMVDDKSPNLRKNEWCQLIVSPPEFEIM